MIWTEIFSVIKGGLLSSNYYKGFVDFKIYFQKLASPCLNKQERRTIYWIFLEYEKWKSEENAFDLMDLVHHISTSNKFRHANYYTEFRIDYLMIDEVQDLTPKTL
jgi:superfamily I DNA/RNA helicase